MFDLKKASKIIYISIAQIMPWGALEVPQTTQRTGTRKKLRVGAEVRKLEMIIPL